MSFIDPQIDPHSFYIGSKRMKQKSIITGFLIRNETRIQEKIGLNDSRTLLYSNVFWRTNCSLFFLGRSKQKGRQLNFSYAIV